MLRRYQIENSKIIETADEKAPVLLYVNPDEAEKRRLVETYQIDEHTLSSALDPDEQARLECEPGAHRLHLQAAQELFGRRSAPVQGLDDGRLLLR